MVTHSNCENGDSVVEKNRRIRTEGGGKGKGREREREEKRSNGQQGDPARQFKLRQMGTCTAGFHCSRSFFLRQLRLEIAG